MTIIALIFIISITSYSYIKVNESIRYSEDTFYKEQNSKLQDEALNYRDKINELQETIGELKNKNNNLESMIGMTFPLKNGSIEQSTRISVQDITIYSDKTEIKIDEPFITSFADTKSMAPIINDATKAIEIKPKQESEIKVGDIISYKKEEQIIAHRVNEIGIDDIGWYAITKGDNIIVQDTEKVRFSQIIGIVVVLVY